MPHDKPDDQARRLHTSYFARRASSAPCESCPSSRPCSVLGVEDDVNRLLSQLDSAIERCHDRPQAAAHSSNVNSLLELSESSEQPACRNMNHSWEPRITFRKPDHQELIERLHDQNMRKIRLYEEEQSRKRSQSASVYQAYQRERMDKYRERVNEINAKSTKCSFYMQVWEKQRTEKRDRLIHQGAEAYHRAEENLHEKKLASTRHNQTILNRSCRVLDQKIRDDKAFSECVQEALNRKEEQEEKIIEQRKKDQVAAIMSKADQYNFKMQMVEKLRQDQFRKQLELEKSITQKSLKVEKFVASKPKYVPSAPIMVVCKREELSDKINQKCREVDSSVAEKFRSRMIYPNKQNEKLQPMHYKEAYCKEPIYRVKERNQYDLEREKKYENRLYKSTNIDQWVVSNQLGK